MKISYPTKHNLNRTKANRAVITKIDNTISFLFQKLQECLLKSKLTKANQMAKSSVATISGLNVL